MIIDINAYLGHWPFRQLRHNTAGDLLKLMDKHGIDKAIVSFINAIFYKDCHAGNIELATEANKHSDRLILFATLNPQYPGWKDDLKQCYEEFGMSGIRIFPHYHNYKLDSEISRDIINLATEMKMPVAMPMRVVDRRQRHWLDSVDDLSLSEIEKTIKECPEAKFIILNGRGFQNSALVKDEKLKSASFLIEISRLSVVLQEEIPKLIETIGPEKIAFGTGVPFSYPTPALLKMQILNASEQIKDKILWENIGQMLQNYPD